MTAWASAHPAVAAWFCAVAFIVTCAGLLLLGRHLLNRDGKRLELHHDGHVQPATPAPAMPAPAEFLAAAPEWAGPFAAIDPYATGKPALPVHEPGKFAGAATSAAGTASLWEHPATDLVPGAGGLPILLTPVTTATCPGDDEPLKVDSPAPEDVPGQDAGTGGKRAADPVTPATDGDQAPGPDGLPEGDTPPLWPPQETAGPGDCSRCGGPRSERWYVPGVTGQPVTCPDDWHDEDAPGPGDHPWWLDCPPASPLAKARAAMDAVAALGVSEYLGQLDGATAYGDDRPLTDYLRDSVVMPAVKATDLDAVARVTAGRGVPR